MESSINIQRGPTISEGIRIATKFKVDNTLLNKLRIFLQNEGIDVLEVKAVKVHRTAYNEEERKKRNYESKLRWIQRNKEKNRKYGSPMPRIVKEFFLTLKPKDNIRFYNYEIPQVELHRQTDNIHAQKIYCQESLYDYLLEKKLITLTDTGIFYKDYVFDKSLLTIAGLTKYFRWNWNYSKETNAWMMETIARGTITPKLPGQKRYPKVNASTKDKTPKNKRKIDENGS